MIGIDINFEAAPFQKPASIMGSVLQLLVLKHFVFATAYY